MFRKKGSTEASVYKKHKPFGLFRHLQEELCSLTKPGPVKLVGMTFGVIAGAYIGAVVIGVVDLLITDVIRLFL